jgi:hypothetical protein
LRGSPSQPERAGHACSSQQPTGFEVCVILALRIPAHSSLRRCERGFAGRWNRERNAGATVQRCPAIRSNLCRAGSHFHLRRLTPCVILSTCKPLFILAIISIHVQRRSGEGYAHIRCPAVNLQPEQQCLRLIVVMPGKTSHRKMVRKVQQ